MRRSSSVRDSNEGVRRCAGSSRLPPLAVPPTTQQMLQDNLSSMPGTQSLVLTRVGTEDWAMRSGTTLSANGGVHRRRQIGTGERLEPLRHDLPGGNKNVPGVLTSGSGLGGGAFLRSPFPQLPSDAAMRGLQKNGESGASSSGSVAPPASGSAAVSSSSAQVAGIGTEPLGAESVASSDSTASAASSTLAAATARCQAVKSLQRLFFDEMSRSGDPNAAAAAALLRLAEETRTSEDGAV
mmetsp:Transcript_4119/g.6993  ORF Transcript_4119/g.6993 Transcript_4119/m.6993 type:complete len:240 (-) Transcript_4119:80-799(-)